MNVAIQCDPIVDRGDEGTFAAALERARGEYLEMPGLQLTEAQAARLWSFDPALCGAVLSELVERKFLVRTRRASFARA
jgi:hypothetical protein